MVSIENYFWKHCLFYTSQGSVIHEDWKKLNSYHFFFSYFCIFPKEFTVHYFAKGKWGISKLVASFPNVLIYLPLDLLLTCSYMLSRAFPDIILYTIPGMVRSMRKVELLKGRSISKMQSFNFKLKTLNFMYFWT